MGTIIKRELKSGDTKYIVQLRVAGTPYESKQFNDEFEALRYESEREAQLRMQASSKKGGTVRGFMDLRFEPLLDYLEKQVHAKAQGFEGIDKSTVQALRLLPESARRLALDDLAQKSPLVHKALARWTMDETV